MARILIIDDNPDVRAVVSGVLASDGHEILEAEDGEQGMALQRTSPASVVITDILMPEKEGIETIRDLVQEFPGTKIIAMSGSGRQLQGANYLDTAKSLGAHAVLRKPFAPEALLSSLREVLRQPAR